MEEKCLPCREFKDFLFEHRTQHCYCYNFYIFRLIQQNLPPAGTERNRTFFLALNGTFFLKPLSLAPSPSLFSMVFCDLALLYAKL